MAFVMTGLSAALPATSRPRAAPAAGLRAFTGMHAHSLGQSNAMDGAAAFGVDNGAMWTMMRHGRKVPHLGRPADQRKALLRALTTEVLRHGAITTTKVKAKAVRPWVDKIILLAKAGGEDKRRQALSWVYDHEVVKSLFEGVPERYAERNNDFSKMSWVKSRRGDNTEMVFLELVD